ncbi:MAG: ABC transporter ATP-binding protein [Acidimicrobiales bacterium]|jgi:putative ABC transport system ATP-binding protein|nr:ABC transporter ATP-binding protein [Acidimicrobiales bacterium]
MTGEPLAEPVLEARDLVKTYREVGGGERPALRGASLAVRPGEWLAIMGPSGCGKSTLLHLLGGLDGPDEGRVLLGGEDLAARSPAERAVLRRERVGYVFQHYNLLAHLDVSANVELPQRLVGVSRRDARERARALLDSLGLGEVARALPGTLSGGQQQRVAVARALVNTPQVLFADEPTGALDSEAAGVVLELLRERHRDGQTIVMVTHDPHVAAAADRVVLLRDGRVVGERSLGEAPDPSAVVRDLLLAEA